MLKMIKRNNKRQNQRAAESKMKGLRGSDARRAVTHKETSVGIRSSGLIHSEALQETLKERYRSSGLLRAELLSVRTV